MQINMDLLIAAPMLQDYLVDKDGTPMSAGIITCYQDNSRTTLKNWYYQSGTPGNYTYIKLPNPLTLSAAGTICDVNGVDTIPFFYPYSELDDTEVQTYYITIVNHALTNQITRANFPFIGQNNNTHNAFISSNNLIINNGFWRNFLPNSLTSSPFSSIILSSGGSSSFLKPISVNIGLLTTLYAGTVAPSQHDGFSFPDIQFVKNNLTANETCTFTPFPLSNKLLITSPVPTNTPEYYINHISSNAGSGETYKCYQFPIILHINNLANVNYTVSLQAQNAGSAGAGSVIQLNILQFTGTGTVSPAPTIIKSTSITLTTSWASYMLSDILPSTSGLTLGNGADDALYLQIQMPLNTASDINFTKPSLYLTPNSIPAYDIQTYDQVNSIISSPRTGDIRTSLNTFYPFGWVAMNDGAIGYDTGSISGFQLAVNSQDTWPLYNMIWNAFSAFSTGSSSSGANSLAPMYTSTGTQVGYGSGVTAPTTAIQDFNANKFISLTKAMGRVLLGGVPVTRLPTTYNATYIGSGNVMTLNGAGNYFNGMPFFTAGASVLTNNKIYYIGAFNGTTQFQVYATFNNAITQTSPISVNGDTGVIFTVYAGSFEGEYAHTQLITELAAHTHPGNAGASFVMGSGGAIQFGAAGSPATTAAITGSTGSSTPFNVTQPGTFYNMYMKL